MLGLDRIEQIGDEGNVIGAARVWGALPGALPVVEVAIRENGERRQSRQSRVVLEFGAVGPVAVEAEDQWQRCRDVIVARDVDPIAALAVGCGDGLLVVARLLLGAAAGRWGCRHCAC